MNKIFTILVIAVFASCKVSYRFNDGTVEGKNAYIKQVNVMAALAPPSSGQVFTEKLQDVMQTQSGVALINSDSADIIIDGKISYYEIRPEGVQANDVAAQNRLTIRVDINYLNTIKPEDNFTQSFTRFANYPSTTDISQVQDDLMDEIFEQIAQDVYNKAFSNW